MNLRIQMLPIYTRAPQMRINLFSNIFHTLPVISGCRRARGAATARLDWKPAFEQLQKESLFNLGAILAPIELKIAYEVVWDWFRGGGGYVEELVFCADSAICCYE